MRTQRRVVTGLLCAVMALGGATGTAGVLRGEPARPAWPEVEMLAPAYGQPAAVDLSTFIEALPPTCSVRVDPIPGGEFAVTPTC